MKNNISREDLNTVIDLLRKDDPILTNGSKVRTFESEWSKWLGIKYSVFVNSGASANLITMSILKINYPEGGEVIVPPLTWVSDIASILQTGFKPVFVDIDPFTLGMDNKKIIQKLNNKTRAVFLSHIQGFNALSNELINILKKRNIPLIEDACESHGAMHYNDKVGSLGWISNFSFYYAHHLSTIEGGMICTNDEKVYYLARMLRSHGMVRESDNDFLMRDFQKNHPDLKLDFIFSYPAFNMRNTEIGAILGSSQLKRLDENCNFRTKNFIRFLDRIDKDIYRTNFKLDGTSNYAFNLILNYPDEEQVKKLTNKMNQYGIEFRRGSSGGGNQLRQPYLKRLMPDKFYLNFPETEHIHFYGFYLGNYPELKFSDIDELCDILNSI